jgi:tetratricopeptide (TPR) repeat protein
LDQVRPEDTLIQKAGLPQIRSVIVRERGDALKAVDLVTPSTQYPSGMAFYHLAQAYLAAGENAKAAVEFEKLIGHRGWPDWVLCSPLAKLGLARAYAKQGEREKSRKAYDDFFTTWKDADRNIPILLQAKAEFKKLQATTSTIASASGNKR